jgi:hypothetical protein
VDLSFARSSGQATTVAIPIEVAVLLVGIAARQAASPTAREQARIEGIPAGHALLAPPHGSFDHATAERLQRWQEP